MLKMLEDIDNFIEPYATEFFAILLKQISFVLLNLQYNLVNTSEAKDFIENSKEFFRNLHKNVKISNFMKNSNSKTDQ